MFQKCRSLHPCVKGTSIRAISIYLVTLYNTYIITSYIILLSKCTECQRQGTLKHVQQLLLKNMPVRVRKSALLLSGACCYPDLALQESVYNILIHITELYHWSNLKKDNKKHGWELSCCLVCSKSNQHAPQSWNLHVSFQLMQHAKPCLR